MSTNNPQRDYDQALELKLAGNTAFKAGDLKLALKNYTRIFMHIGMNPCMNLSEMMNSGGAPNLDQKPAAKDPVQHQTDLLRLTAFNNIAAVYSKMGNWEQCKEKCTRVLKHDPKNAKALFRRGKAYRKLNLYELARSDLKKVKELSTTSMAAVDNELKQLVKDEKNASKEIQAIYKKNMREAKRRQLNKKKRRKMRSKNAKSVPIEDKVIENKDGSIKHLMSNDTNENLCRNTNDNEYVWDKPLINNERNSNSNNSNTNVVVVEKVSDNSKEELKDIVINLKNANADGKQKCEENVSKEVDGGKEDVVNVEDGDGDEQLQHAINITNDDIQPTMF